MSRIAVLCALTLLGGLLVFGHAAPDAVRTAPVPDKADKPAPVTAKLSKPVKFEGIDAAVSLRDLIENLEKKYEIDIEVNEEAFTGEGVADVMEAKIGEKPIRKKAAIRLDRLLNTLVSKLPVPSGATFVVRGNTIEITTHQMIRQQIWGGHIGPYLPLVNATFEKLSLSAALKELSEQSEYNIVVDARVGEKADAAVNARFANIPLDTAVTFLADMAELKIVQQDNLIYVTTPENAALWEAKLKVSPESAEAANGPRVGSGVGTRPAVAPIAP